MLNKSKFTTLNNLNKKINSGNFLKLWISFEYLQNTFKNPNFFSKFLNFRRYEPSHSNNIWDLKLIFHFRKKKKKKKIPHTKFQLRDIEVSGIVGLKLASEPIILIKVGRPIRILGQRK